MSPNGCTSMWQGLKEGLAQFGNKAPTNPCATFLLTDGKPVSVVEPSEGCGQAMRKLQKLPSTIHTFGFGYALQLGVLQSIAELGGGI